MIACRILPCFAPASTWLLTSDEPYSLTAFRLKRAVGFSSTGWANSIEKESEIKKAHMLVLNEQVAPTPNPFEDLHSGQWFARVNNRRASAILEIAAGMIVALHADIGRPRFARNLYADRESKRLHFRMACLPEPAIKLAGVLASHCIDAKLDAIVLSKRAVGRQKQR